MTIDLRMPMPMPAMHSMMGNFIDPRLIRQPLPAEPAAPRRRTKIWEISTNLHCSVIGTCLSTAELRHVLLRAGQPLRDMTEHELHTEAVRMAARHDGPAKILNKVLDTRHRLAIRQFEKAGDEAQLLALWRQSVRRGDIPGAYWAALTHPATTDRAVRVLFGEVHMLSHLVGAANRADIRRLCVLEQDLAALRDKAERQQTQLRDAIVGRDARISELSRTLSARIAGEHPPQDNAAGDAELSRLVAGLERRLSAEETRRAKAERRAAELQEDLDREARARGRAEERAAGLAEELDAISAVMAPDAAVPAEALPGLGGRTLLYVGGMSHYVARLRAAAQARDAQFLHHDGGTENSGLLLAGLISRADLVLFPVDCISHEAALAVKRLCRQLGKRFVPLRASGLGSFVAALAREAAPALPA